MSDVLVKNMEMPEGCVECPLLLAYGSRLENKTIHHCMGRLPEDSRFSDDADLTKRPKEGCPLVEVKDVTVDNHNDAQELAFGLWVNKTKIYLEKRDGHTD